MARGSTVQVSGAKTLRRQLKAAGVSIDDLKAAHADVADQVLARATPGAPRRTGKLAGTGRASGTQGAAIVRFGGAAVPYAGPIHWGWPSRHIAAQPFVADAAEDTRPQWEGTYLAALEKIIDTVEGAPGE